MARMRLTMIHPAVITFLIGIFISAGCHTDHKSSAFAVEREPVIEPDYSGVTVPYNIATRMNQDNAFNYIVDDVFNNFHPRDVWSDGELKMENYETIWDEEEIYAHASESAMKLWQRIGGE